MKKICLLLFLCLSAVAGEVPNPIVEKADVPYQILKPEDKEKWQEDHTLTPDEIEFVKNQFMSSVVQAAEYQCVQPEMGPDGKAYVSINHPKDNIVVKYVCTKLWKSHQEMVGEIYDAVYKEADKKNNNTGFRVWDYNGELLFVGNKILDRVKVDKEFYTELTVLVKRALKK